MFLFLLITALLGLILFISMMNILGHPHAHKNEKWYITGLIIGILTFLVTVMILLSK